MEEAPELEQPHRMLRPQQRLLRQQHQQETADGLQDLMILIIVQNLQQQVQRLIGRQAIHRLLQMGVIHPLKMVLDLLGHLQVEILLEIQVATDKVEIMAQQLLLPIKIVNLVRVLGQATLVIGVVLGQVIVAVVMEVAEAAVVMVEEEAMVGVEVVVEVTGVAEAVVVEEVVEGIGKTNLVQLKILFS